MTPFLPLYNRPLLGVCTHIGFSDHGKTLYRGTQLYTVPMVQKLSSKQQNHLKEGHKGGGPMFKFVGKLFNLFRR